MVILLFYTGIQLDRRGSGALFQATLGIPLLLSLYMMLLVCFFFLFYFISIQFCTLNVYHFYVFNLILYKCPSFIYLLNLIKSLMFGTFFIKLRYFYGIVNSHVFLPWNIFSSYQFSSVILRYCDSPVVYIDMSKKTTFSLTWVGYHFTYKN